MTDEVEELASVDALLASMTAIVQSPDPLGEELRGLADGAFCASSQLSPLARVDIYREQFWLRHIDSLEEDFPATRTLVGDAWPAIVRGYLVRYPPRTPSLRELGFDLPDYLAALDAEEVSGLARDMARLECAYLQVFDAVDEPPLDSGDVAQLEPEQWLSATFRISGALRLLELDFEAADVRRSLRAGQDASHNAGPRRHHLAVYRRELGLWDQEISAEACDLLRRLAAGAPLAVACEATALALPSAGPLLDAHLGEWFASWSRLGWIRGIVAGRD